MNKLLLTWIGWIGRSFRRFLVTNIAALALALLYTQSSSYWFFDITAYGEGPLPELITLCFLLIPVSALIHLLSERLRLGTGKMILLHAAGTSLVALYALIVWRPDAQHGFVTTGLFVSTAALAAITPYLWNREHLGRHVLQLCTSFFQSLLMALTLFAGVMFISFTLEQLFQLELSLLRWHNVASLAFLFVWPVLFLGLHPEQDQSPRAVSAVYRALLLFISFPLLLIYTVILYVYFIKIAVELEFPANMMANLVAWYLLVAIVTQYMIRSIDQVQGEFSRWVIAASRHFGYALIVPIAVLLYSVGVRLATYGVTIPRYFLLLISVFTALSTGLLLWKRKNAQQWIAVIAIGLLLFASVGPFSAWNVSLRSQTRRFDALFAQYGEELRAHASSPDSAITPEIEAMRNIARYLEWELNVTPEVLRDDAALYDALHSYGVFGYPLATATTWSHYFREADDVAQLSERRWMFTIEGPGYARTLNLTDTLTARLENDVLVLERTDASGSAQIIGSVNVAEVMNGLDLTARRIVVERELGGGYVISLVPSAVHHRNEGGSEMLDYYISDVLIEHIPSSTQTP